MFLSSAHARFSLLKIVSFRIDRLADLQQQKLLTTPIQVYDHFLNRVIVTFKPRYDDSPTIPRHEFDLILSKKDNYDHVRLISIHYSPRLCRDSSHLCHFTDGFASW